METDVECDGPIVEKIDAETETSGEKERRRQTETTGEVIDATSDMNGI